MCGLIRIIILMRKTKQLYTLAIYHYNNLTVVPHSVSECMTYEQEVFGSHST